MVWLHTPSARKIVMVVMGTKVKLVVEIESGESNKNGPKQFEPRF